MLLPVLTQVWLYFLSLLFFTVSFCIFFPVHETIYTIRVSVVFDFYYRTLTYNLTERENLQNSDCPFRFLFKDFLLCSRYSKVSYSAKHVCKPLFGSSATIFRLTCSELSLSINVKKLKRSPGNCRTKYKLADGVTALAQLRVLYSGRARSFNR